MYSLGNGPKLDPSHLAESFLSPTALDKSGAGVRALTESLAAVLPVGHAPLWGGETAAANNGGQSGELPSSEVVTPPLHHRYTEACAHHRAFTPRPAGLTDTFVDSFWYLDQLGQHAASGSVSLFLRQCLLARGGYPLVELATDVTSLTAGHDVTAGGSEFLSCRYVP